MAPLPGGVAVKLGNEIIAAFGIAGSPGGDKDQACAQIGVGSIQNYLGEILGTRETLMRIAARQAREAEDGAASLRDVAAAQRQARRGGAEGERAAGAAQGRVGGVRDDPTYRPLMRTCAFPYPRTYTQGLSSNGHKRPASRGGRGGCQH